MRPLTTLATTCTAFALLLGLAACRPAVNAEEAPSPDASVPAASTPAPVAATSESTEQAVVADAATPVPMATQAPATAAPVVLASADGERSSTRVEVTELKRGSGDTVSLKFTLINDSDEEFGLSGMYLGNSSVGSDYKGIGGVHLVDAAGKKKYLVVRDAEQICLCSRELQDLKPKSRVNLWAKFPAPPTETQRISIVIPHFSPMDDIPISQ